MQLPEYGMTLRFAVPAEPREMAQAGGVRPRPRLTN